MAEKKEKQVKKKMFSIYLDIELYNIIEKHRQKLSDQVGVPISINRLVEAKLMKIFIEEKKDD